jgi:hypothetical protein
MVRPAPALFYGVRSELPVLVACRGALRSQRQAPQRLILSVQRLLLAYKTIPRKRPTDNACIGAIYCFTA